MSLILPLLFLFLPLSSGSAGVAPSDPGEDAAAAEINWMTFEEATAKVQSDVAAGRETKMIFIEIFATWCPYCKRLDTTTMTDASIIEKLNDRFYPVRFDGEDKRDISFAGYTFKFVPSGDRGYHELAAGLAGGQLSYPTLVFMNEDLKVVQPLPGYRAPEELLPILSFFGDGHYTHTSWESFMEAFEQPATE